MSIKPTPSGQRLCIVYQAETKTRNKYFPKKREAVLYAQRHEALLWRVHIDGAGTLREAVCRLLNADTHRWTRQRIADYRAGQEVKRS